MGGWVKIRSWHSVLTPTRMFDTYRTRCGRTATSKDVRNELPLDEKSCETCLRFLEAVLEPTGAI